MRTALARDAFSRVSSQVSFLFLFLNSTNCRLQTKYGYTRHETRQAASRASLTLPPPSKPRTGCNAHGKDDGQGEKGLRWEEKVRRLYPRLRYVFFFFFLYTFLIAIYLDVDCMLTPAPASNKKTRNSRRVKTSRASLLPSSLLTRSQGTRDVSKHVSSLPPSLFPSTLKSRDSRRVKTRLKWRIARVVGL